MERRLSAASLLALLSLFALSPLSAAENKPAGTPQAPARDPRTLRVMTYNIHICQGMDKRFDPQRIADVIKREDVDVVALQEVDNKARRSGKVDQVAELVRLTGMHGLFGKARDYDGGEYGQAILSRQPIEKFEVHKLTAAGEQLAATDERIALVARIKQPRPLPDLVFVGTHLHHVSDVFRVSEANVLNGLLADAVATREPAVMVLGDFNARPDSKVITAMRERWDDPTADVGMTFPADKPDRKIDYVLLPKGHGWKVVSAKVVDEPMASDHRPVVVELQWKD
jgi:endonuclease/exonuclease/phosphatase family metal-dependent hydrolase